MKMMFKQLSKVAMLLAITTLVLSSCKNEETPTPGPELTGKSETFTLNESNNSGIFGTIKFEERTDNSTVITMALTGATGDHPAHIHANTAVEGGGIMLDLTTVDASGASVTEVATLNDGSAITYDQLIVFDGYVNVHKSAEELGVLVSQGDIGQNALTGASENYELFEAKAGVSGKVKFKERNNGETLVVVELTGTTAGAEHAAHVHANTVSEGGGILVTLNKVNGDSGIGQTNVSATDDGTAIVYSEWTGMNAYVQVHDTDGTPIARGDIGMNELTGKSEMYDLSAKSNPDISGTAKFEERKSGNTLVTVNLANTTMGDSHPAHIHMGTAAVGGGIAITLTSINGDNGLSYTNISTLNDGMTAITYDELVEYDGYINVHNSASDLGTLVAQGDIGQNALTGTEMIYSLNELNTQGVTGTITFAERNNGFALVSISISGAGVVGDQAAHIHDNNVSMGGGVAISLSNVDANGISLTSVTALNNGTEMTYSDMIGFNGYAQIHNPDLSALTNGNIGSNN